MGKDGFNPVMPAGTSFLSNTHCPNRNIHIIVDNDQIFTAQFVVGKHGPDRFPAVIHISQWFDKENFFSADTSFCNR